MIPPVLPAGLLMDGRTGDQAALEADRGDPGRKGVPEFADLDHDGVAKLNKGAVEEGGDATEGNLVEELRQFHEPVEESVDRRDGLRELRPEVAGDDVQQDADHETAQAATAEGLGQIVKPCQESSAEGLEIAAAAQGGKGRADLFAENVDAGGLGSFGLSVFGFGLNILHGVILLVVGDVGDLLLGDCGFCVLDANVLLIHVILLI